MPLKVAILILVHKNKPQLVRLIEHLKTSFHLYIHIDNRSSLSLAEYAQDANVQAFKKYNTYWGHENALWAILFLYQQAAKKKYDRYVLISGQDVPLKTNKEILAFFEVNPLTNFINSTPILNHPVFHDRLNRVLKFHSVPLSRLSLKEKIVLRPVITLTKIVGFFFNRYRKLDYEFQYGDTWMDLTGSCVTNLLRYIEVHPEYVRRFRYTGLTDEIFFQTLICSLLKEKNIKNVSRYIDWKTGPEYPRTLTIEDKQALLRADALFARKFDCTKDNTIIDSLYNNIS